MLVYVVMLRVTRGTSVPIVWCKTKEQAYDYIEKELEQIMLEQNIFSGEIINRYFVQEKIIEEE